MHQLMFSFLEINDEFLVFAQNSMTETMCKEIQNLTQNQSDDLLWFELRYGRITASKIYEAAHCHTPDGSLVNEIIGASKAFQSNAMKRGKELEHKALVEIKKKEKLSYRRCGLFLLPSCPIIGASPDAIGSDFIIEVKCPASADGFNKFLPKGLINAKCKAQMYLQMLCANKKKGLFYVADPNFENNKKITTVWLTYDEHF